MTGFTSSQSYLVSLRVFLVKGSNIESVSSVDFASRRNQRWRIFLHVDLLPVDTKEKRMAFDFFRSVIMRHDILISIDRNHHQNLINPNMFLNIHSYPLPRQPSRLSTSRWSSPSSKVLSSLEKLSGSSTFYCAHQPIEKRKKKWKRTKSINNRFAFYRIHISSIRLSFVFHSNSYVFLRLVYEIYVTPYTDTDVYERVSRSECRHCINLLKVSHVFPFECLR